MKQEEGKQAKAWAFGVRAAIFFATAMLALLLAMGGRGQVSAGTATAVSLHAGAPPNPDESCARCHRAIYERYEATPMSRGSGPAVSGLIPGAFFHAKSGIAYRLFVREGAAWLSYTRPNPAPGRFLAGEVPLQYFVGSGTRGRTYLFEQDGFWFETPVNWYSKKAVWDMAPNYLDAREMPFTLPVDPNCLHCHATGVAASLPGSRNHFAGAPFAEGGVRCSSCHGESAAHVASGGRAAILNPARLTPTRRDSVCLQCHLEGETAVYPAGHSLAAYKPGQDLFQDVSYFVHKGEIGPGGRASSQWEALLQSACKRGSGERLTCTTCHDPHGSEQSATPAERVGFYRAKCLDCHSGAKFATTHHPEQPDCASCHMPRRNAEDIAHEQVTDHRIQLPGAYAGAHAASPVAPAASAELVPVGSGVPGESQRVSDRELGLAYAQLAQHGDRASGERALPLLRAAELDERSAADPQLHTELGFLLQMSGNRPGAASEYRAALRANPEDSTASGDLAVLFGGAGDFATAVPLWERAFAEDPTQVAAGFNLAVGECLLGRPEAASATLSRVLLFAPDDGRARKLAAAIAGGQQHCSASARQ